MHGKEPGSESMVTLEQVNEIVQIVVKAALAVTQAQGRNHDSPSLSEKSFKRLEKLDKSKWNKWSLQFKVALRAASSEYNMLIKTEKQSDPMDLIDIEAA